VRKTPSSRPVRKTTGNSSPFAVCRVMRVTTPPPSSASGSSSRNRDAGLYDGATHALRTAARER